MLMGTIFSARLWIWIPYCGSSETEVVENKRTVRIWKQTGEEELVLKMRKDLPRRKNWKRTLVVIKKDGKKSSLTEIN